MVASLVENVLIAISSHLSYMSSAEIIPQPRKNHDVNASEPKCRFSDRDHGIRTIPPPIVRQLAPLIFGDITLPPITEDLFSAPSSERALDIHMSADTY